MLIWQINWNSSDKNHKLFCLSSSRYNNGKTRFASNVVSFDYAITRRGAYYFYLEIIK